MTSDGTNLTGLWIEKQKYFAATALQDCRKKADLPVFIQAAQWLDKYFQKQNPAISELPLAPEGGEFRQMIWKILCDIPLGQVWTYGGIAKMVARKTGKAKMSAQAAGGAVGHNPISIIIPCHRVLGAKGALTGFGYGLERKKQLLDLEKITYRE